jgi:predicted  nucleic acid-binding Zn-ribbon protein
MPVLTKKERALRRLELEAEKSKNKVEKEKIKVKKIEKFQLFPHAIEIFKVRTKIKNLFLSEQSIRAYEVINDTTIRVYVNYGDDRLYYDFIFKDNIDLELDLILFK